MNQQFSLIRFPLISNLSDQPENISKKIESDGMSIEKLIETNELIKIFEKTRERYKRKNDSSRLKLHAMRKNSKLDGEENYFTTDLNQKGRLLWSLEYETNQVKSINFIGVVDTHTNNYNNLLTKDQISTNKQHVMADYLEITVTKRLNSNNKKQIYIKKIKK